MREEKNMKRDVALDNGFDRWTSNGYGLVFNGEPVPDPEPEEKDEKDIDEIEEI